MAPSLILLRIGSALLVAAAVATPAAAVAADRYERSFDWSGYRWSVRSTRQPAAPGPNRWDDTRRHVRVRRDGTLRLRIVKDRSVDVVGPRTGYGRYRWTVETDLSTADPFRVAAFFVQGTKREQDIEFSRWGFAEATDAGSWVTWRRSVRLAFGAFAVPPAPPFRVVIDWAQGTTRFAVRDATGATLLDTTVPTGAGGRHIAPHISYWHYRGAGAVVSPYTAQTVHPPLIVRSFHYRRSAPRGRRARTSLRVSAHADRRGSTDVRTGSRTYGAQRDT